MADELIFVDSALSTVLDISDASTYYWNEDQSTIPLPDFDGTYVEATGTDGASYLEGRYPNIELTISLTVRGTSVATLDAAVRALWDQITKPNILKVTPHGGTAVYYETFPYTKGQGNFHRKNWRREGFCMLEFTLQARPHPFTAEQTITVVENLILNGGFETAGTGGEPFANWTKTETAGSGAATVAADTDSGDYVFGSKSCNLKTTASDSVAKVETAAITVDKTKHYNMVFNYQCEQGTLDKLTCVIRQFDSGHNDLNDDITITPTVTAEDNWYYSTTVIHPAGEGGNDWHTNCAEVKICFCVTGAAANPTEYQVDGAKFTCSEYLSGNELSNALGIVLPPAALAGDVKSPCDIYIAKSNGCANTVATYIGGRERYSGAYDPCLEAITGTTAYSNKANRGTLKSWNIPVELAPNQSFETITGTPGSNSETWGDWTAARDSSAYLVASTLAAYAGTYGILSYSPTISKVNSITTTNYITLAGLTDHMLTLWYKMTYVSGGGLSVSVLCYSAASALLGTLTPIRLQASTGWTQASATILSTDWPAGTTKVKIKIVHGMGTLGPGVDKAYFDLISLQASPSPMVIDGASSVGDIEGKAKVFLHYCLNSAQTSKSITLQGNLDVGGTDITDLAEIQTETVDMPATYVYQGDGTLNPMSLPTHRYADTAATSSMSQELQALFDPSLAAGTAYMDDLVLLPVDNGYATVPSDNNQYLIFDSQSEVPAVLVSTDGTINKAVWHSSGRLINPFSLNPRDGSNLAILNVWADADGHQYGQCLLDNVTIKYKPRYLVVA